MKPFTNFVGLVVPLDVSNVDTDAIIPKQFMKSVRRTGFGPYLFDSWRYLDSAEYGVECDNRPRNETFVLNFPRFHNASILLTRRNFGCGSSREHAVWALEDYGINVIVAESFADIFFANCVKVGVLPLTLSSEAVEQLFKDVNDINQFSLMIDLQVQTVTASNGRVYTFQMAEAVRRLFIEGKNEMDFVLDFSESIKMFESWHREQQPWLFIRDD